MKSAREARHSWTAAELEADPDWIYELSANEADELVRECKRHAGRGNSDVEMQRGEFVAPRTEELFRAVNDEILHGRGAALVRGLPTAELSTEENRTLLLGIGSFLGAPEPQDEHGAILHDIRATGVSVLGSDTARGYKTDGKLLWHGDGGDAFALLCLSQSHPPAVSHLVSAAAVYEEMQANHPELLSVLAEPYFFDARGWLASGSRYQKVPIFTHHLGRLFVMYKLAYVYLAQRFDEVPRLTEQQNEALRIMDELCSSPRFCYAFELAPGDMQLANNYWILHAREAYKDTPEHTRHLLRLWLTLADGFELPAVYENTREFGGTYDKRKEARLNRSS